MGHFQRTVTWTLVAAGLAALLPACQTEPQAKGRSQSAPATIDNPAVETELSAVTLTPDAEQRLGIEVARVEPRKASRTRAYSGDLLVPPGRAVTVSAPLSGALMVPAHGNLPRPGTGVEAGQEIFRLLPLTPPQQDLERLEAEARARLAEVQARTRRTRQLYDEGIVALSFFEQDTAALALAEADLQSVVAQKEMLGPSVVCGGGGVTALSIRAPLTARLGAIYAAPGQTVSAAAPLFDLLGDDSLWVRVPVYVGDLESIDHEREALIHGLRGLEAETSSFEPRIANPVAAPPSANPDAATVDLFFELPGSGGDLQPGQKVGVTLARKGEDETTETLLTLPQSAIVYDIHGGTWVYERRSPQRYVRRRVEVSHVQDGVGFLTRGPSEGTLVVSVGTAELFGAEFGADK